MTSRPSTAGGGGGRAWKSQEGRKRKSNASVVSHHVRVCVPFPGIRDWLTDSLTHSAASPRPPFSNISRQRLLPALLPSFLPSRYEKKKSSSYLLFFFSAEKRKKIDTYIDRRTVDGRHPKSGWVREWVGKEAQPQPIDGRTDKPEWVSDWLGEDHTKG